MLKEVFKKRRREVQRNCARQTNDPILEIVSWPVSLSTITADVLNPYQILGASVEVRGQSAGTTIPNSALHSYAVSIEVTPNILWTGSMRIHPRYSYQFCICVGGDLE